MTFLLVSAAVLSACLGLPHPDEEQLHISVLSLIKPTSITIEARSLGTLLCEESKFKPIYISPADKIKVALENDNLRISLLWFDGSTTKIPLSKGCRLGAPGGDFTFDVQVLEPVEFRRSLRGELEISVRSGNLLLVLKAPVEQVVGEVVAAEMPDDAPAGALEALAVAVRSYATYMRGRHRGEGFDLCDSTHCILYRGLDGAFVPEGGTGGGTVIGRRAAESTAGMVLTDGRDVVPGYFHACCGGATATPAMIWPGAPQATRFGPVRCDFCKGSPHFRWRRSAAASEVISALGLPECDGKLRFEPETYPESFFVKQVKVFCGVDSFSFGGEQFRMRVGRALGWNVVRSNAFKINVVGAEVVFEGGGFGHGVGLCQEGAKAAALQGWDWRRIISFYFPRCSVSSHKSLCSKR